MRGCSSQYFNQLPVNKFPADAALEEPGTSITGKDSVMFSRAGVTANHANQTQVLCFPSTGTASLAYRRQMLRRPRQQSILWRVARYGRTSVIWGKMHRELKQIQIHLAVFKGHLFFRRARFPPLPTQNGWCRPECRKLAHSEVHFRPFPTCRRNRQSMSC